MALVSSIFYAGYFLITQVARTRLTTITYIWLVDLFAAGFLMLINLGLGNPFGPYPASTWVVFIAAGLFSQVGGYFSIGYALGHLPASVVSPTLLLQPVITAMLAIPLFGETLNTGQIVGGLVALGGIYLLNISRMRSDETSGIAEEKASLTPFRFWHAHGNDLYRDHGNQDQRAAEELRGDQLLPDEHKTE